MCNSGDPDARLQVFVQGSDGALWSIWQSPPGLGWGNWRFLDSGPIGSEFAFRPCAIGHGNGCLSVFIKGADGNFWCLTQTGVGATGTLIDPPWGQLITPA